MASSSSPSASSTSSISSAFLSSQFASLSVMSLRDRIVEKVRENRVTLIVGEAGCGKSSQVPQFLLEANMEPILCTQPRRFAVVAVAKMVAKVRNSELGGEIGYHIGRAKHFSTRTKIFFKTAGVLLDEMRDKGLNALNYKVIVLDEVHERSVESDLVLVCVKQFLMKNRDFRLVLMSATADIGRYRNYFNDLGRDERVEVLAIPNSQQKIIYQRPVLYLDQISEFLGVERNLLTSRCCSSTSASLADADMKPEVHKIIHDLVLRIHEKESDIEKSILVFLPTYSSLEKQWKLLRPLSSFKVHILHSSIDTEQALMAMKIWKSHRKVILATNIAESSVTIPKVAYVIDSCRSLQVFWDSRKKKDSAKLVWVSKSQAEQRRGRTGRTCDGEIYRLVTQSFFNEFESYEYPSILRLSLRQQVLLICCAEAKSINDPNSLFLKSLDPPEPKVVEDALNLLVHMGALEKTLRGHYEPTFYGRLLSSFSLSFDASVLILKFGDIGMLREGILLGVLMDTQPLPILHPFGEEDLHAKYIECFYNEDEDNIFLLGRKETLFMGNLCAYQFWQRVFKDKERLARLMLKLDDKKVTPLLHPKIEEDWCSFHHIVMSSVNHVSDICIDLFSPIEDVLHSVHRFRPKFLGTCDGIPLHYYPCEFEHKCLFDGQENENAESVVLGNDDIKLSQEGRNCTAVPFVTSNHFQADCIAKEFSNIIKEIRIQCAEDMANQVLNSHDQNSFVHNKNSLCTFFLNGSCNKGTQCLFSHFLESKGPACKFFFSLQGCRNGNSCHFSHDSSTMTPLSKPTSCLPETSDGYAKSFQRIISTSRGSILVLDDTDFHFSSNLAAHFDSSKIICTTSLSYFKVCDTSLTGVRILWGLKHPHQTLLSKSVKNPVPWFDVKFLLWFPNFHSYGEDLSAQRLILEEFFGFLALRMLADELHGIQVILTMNNIIFSLLQVEKLASDGFFFLSSSFPFDEAKFGAFPAQSTAKKPMMVSKPVSYVFKLLPPSGEQCGDYVAALRQSICNIHHDTAFLIS